jgi:hypothetical protein
MKVWFMFVWYPVGVYLKGFADVVMTYLRAAGLWA